MHLYVSISVSSIKIDGEYMLRLQRNALTSLRRTTHES